MQYVEFTTLISEMIKIVWEHQNNPMWILWFFEALSSRVWWPFPCGKKAKNIETVLEMDNADNYVLFLVFL